MAVKYALVSDFDGTITFEDFFWYVTDKWLDEKSLEPWREYLAGQESHINALNRIFEKIRVPERELAEFIASIPYDKSFPKTAACCLQKNIPFYICSAGCDYYINKLIGDIIRRDKITLVTNRGVYSERHGLKMIPPKPSDAYYDKEVGISKAAVVSGLKKQGYRVVFAGDGPPDTAPARLADVVFAKKLLLAACREDGIKTLPFTDYEDIYHFIKEV